MEVIVDVVVEDVDRDEVKIYFNFLGNCPERSFIKKKVFIYVFFVLIFCPSI